MKIEEIKVGDTLTSNGRDKFNVLQNEGIDGFQIQDDEQNAKWYNPTFAQCFEPYVEQADSLTN
jgi:hypothetical protein